jgi:glycosyltransferase involved in cell wall biosynthesis
MKVLFICHDASRTGAPIVFLHLLRWLKNNTALQMTILVKDDGDMIDQFQAIAATYVLNPRMSDSFVKRQYDKIYKKIKHTSPEQAGILKEVNKTKYDLVYTNTVVCHELLPLLSPYQNCPFVSHIHENEFTIRNFYPTSMDSEFTKCIGHYIAVSESTKQNLVENFGVDSRKIKLFYEFVPLAQINNPTIDGNTIKAELGITDEFVIGGSGLTNWRKGIDLFVQLAEQLHQQQAEFKFKLVWVGNASTEVLEQHLYEAKRIGILNHIIFTGTKSTPQNYFQIFDIFALTSREDPFPLVAIESGMLGKPIICFDNAGGIPELVYNGGGNIVPYGNVPAMATAILKLANDKNLLHQKSEEIKSLVKQYDVNVIAPQIYDWLKEVSVGD